MLFSRLKLMGMSYESLLVFHRANSSTVQRQPPGEGSAAPSIRLQGVKSEGLALARQAVLNAVYPQGYAGSSPAPSASIRQQYRLNIRFVIVLAFQNSSYEKQLPATAFH